MHVKGRMPAKGCGGKEDGMRAHGILILLGLTLLGPSLAFGQSDPMAARLSAERVSDVAVGAYSAADNVDFSLLPYGDKYLLHFDGNPETFVLYGDRVALGARELKYDSGALAMKISVWGGITLYTQDKPGGLPATRTGDATPLPKLAVPTQSLAAAIADEEHHLFYVQQLKLVFSADPAVMAGNDDMRAFAFDTLINSEMGIERFIAGPQGRAAFTHKFDAVKVIIGEKPLIAISGRTLLVSFVPSAGAAGRASSRAIAFALGKMLSVHQPA
jgi:hypothetical protein